LRIYAYIKISDAKKFLWIIEQMKDLADFWIYDQGPRQMAYEYRNILQQNIVTQKFKAGWSARAQRYSVRYPDWKHQHFRGSYGQFWILRGDLIRLLKSAKGIWHVRPFAHLTKLGMRGQFLGGPKRKFWMVGFPAGAMDAGGKSWLGGGGVGVKKSIAMYARLLEKGGKFTDSRGRRQEHPARPIMEPTLKGYRRREAQTKGRWILRRICRPWRRW
jgi:hypothetical protein